MLDLRFSTRAGRVEISCSVDLSPQLHALRTRFSSSASIGGQAFDVAIDDFLVNLFELASWPASDADIIWQPELLRLVEANAADAAVVEARIVRGAIGERDTGDVLAPSLRGGWAASFTDFQTRDLARLLELAHGANFSVPGAGKTRVALALYQASRDAGDITRMLVVCPKSAFESWFIEAELCYPDHSVRLALFEGHVPPGCDVLLINYDRLPEAWPALLQWLRAHPAMLVLDEAHRMKRGPLGAWGSACLSLGPYAARRLILTGTPAPNGAQDLGNLLAFVWPGQGRAAVARAIIGNDLRTASQELRPLFVRTTKNELNLPPVDLAIRRVELPPLHREVYDALLGQASAGRADSTNDVEALGRVLMYLIMAATSPALLATGSSRYDPLPYRIPPLQPPIGTTLTALLRDLPNYELSPKYQEVAKIVRDNAVLGRKTLVWSTFVRNLTSLELLLARYSPAVVHGGVEDRSEQLHRFREDPACLVLLSNPATLGEGVSLHQVCHDAVYLDRDFAAGRFLQSLDRIHRLGLPPTAHTQITLLVATNTIDELIEQRLAAKLRFIGGILDDPEVLALGELDEEPSASAGMDETDIRALISYLDSSAPT